LWLAGVAVVVARDWPATRAEIMAAFSRGTSRCAQYADAAARERCAVLFRILETEDTSNRLLDYTLLALIPPAFGYLVARHFGRRAEKPRLTAPRGR
jgi:hypothetical protein